MSFKTDIEIAQEASMLKISEVAENLGLNEDDIELCGKYKAKLNLDLLDKENENGNKNKHSDNNNNNDNDIINLMSMFTPILIDNKRIIDDDIECTCKCQCDNVNVFTKENISDLLNTDNNTCIYNNQLSLFQTTLTTTANANTTNIINNIIATDKSEKLLITGLILILLANTFSKPKHTWVVLENLIYLFFF